MNDFCLGWIIIIIALVFLIGTLVYDSNTAEITASNFVQLEGWVKDFPQLKQTEEFTEAIQDNKISNREFEGLSDKVKEFKDQQKMKKLLSVATQPTTMRIEAERNNFPAK